MKFKAGDIIRSPYGSTYEVIDETYAVFSWNQCCFSQDWDDCVLIGNVKDNPELSCKGRDFSSD